MTLNRRASLRKTINNLNLSEAEEVLKSKYKYTPGKPGRPPLSPTGIFLSFTIMFLRMQSYRDYHAFLEKDKFWRRTLGFKKTPDIGNFSHFLNRIGLQTFEKLFQSRLCVFAKRVNRNSLMCDSFKSFEVEGFDFNESHKGLTISRI